MRIVPVVGGILFVVFWIRLAASPEKGGAAKGKETYARFCATCHGSTGKGEGPGVAALNPKPRELLIPA